MLKLFLSSKGDCSFWKCHPIPGSGGRGWKFQCSGASWVGPWALSHIVWFCGFLFSWHLIITQLFLILPLRSSTTWWYLVVAGILRDSKTAGKNISGKKEKLARTKQKMKAVLSCGSVCRWTSYFLIFPPAIFSVRQSLLWQQKDIITLWESVAFLIQSKTRCSG